MAEAYISTVVSRGLLALTFLIESVPKKGWAHLCNECPEDDVTAGARVCVCVCVCVCVDGTQVGSH